MKNNRKQKFFSIAAFALPFFFSMVFFGMVYADPPPPPPWPTSTTNPPWPSSTTNGPGIQNPLKAKSLTEFLTAALDTVVQVGAIFATIFIIYAGFLFVTAQGNEEKLQSAKRTFMWTVIGVGVLLGAKAISLGIKGTIDKLSTGLPN